MNRSVPPSRIIPDLAPLANQMMRDQAKILPTQTQVQQQAATSLAAGAFVQKTIDLTITTPTPHVGDCYGVMVLYEGSTPGVVLTVDTGTGAWDMVPGDVFWGVHCQGITWKRGPGSVAGAAQVLILTHPDVRVARHEPPESVIDRFELELVANSTGEDPAATGAAGLDVTRKKRVRVWLAAENGETLSGGGSVRIWARNDVTGEEWALTNLAFAVPSGTRHAMVGEFEVGVGDGDVYAEPLSVTVSGGTAVTVYVEAL